MTTTEIAMQSSDPTAAGTPLRIGPYRVLERLGEGGMAEAFKAVLERDGGFQRVVCIKRALHHDNPTELADLHASFAQEARILAELDHPGVVQAYDCGTDDGRSYLVMQYVDGIDLGRLIKSLQDARTPRRLLPGLAAHIVAEIAEALHYIHHFVNREGIARAVVHRDVSPHNILISRSGDVKLADFGIAAFHGRPNLTAKDSFRGKLPYSSPEQIDSPRGLDGRSDLFSLGAVAYECLTGLRAFEHPSIIDHFKAVQTGSFDPILGCVPSLDPELARFVEGMLSPTKDERPASGRTVAMMLRMLAPHSSPRMALATLVQELLGDEPAPHSSETFLDAVSQHLSRSESPRSATRSKSQDAARSGKAAPVFEPALPTAEARVSRPPASDRTPRAPEPEREPIATRPTQHSRRTGRWLGGAAALALTATVAGAAVVASQRDTPRAPSPSSPPPETVTPPAPEPLTSAKSAAEPQLAQLPPPSVPAPTDEDTTAPMPSAVPAEPLEPSNTASARRAGSLRVASSPWGHIWVDGTYRGRTPPTLVVDRLSAGPHEVAVSTDLAHPGPVTRVRITAGSVTDFTPSPHSMKANP